MKLDINKAKKLIKEKGYRRDWIAEQIGVKLSSMHQILNGHAVLGVKKIEKLGILLGEHEDSLKEKED